jgi:hypothetical protein
MGGLSLTVCLNSSDVLLKVHRLFAMRLIWSLLMIRHLRLMHRTYLPTTIVPLSLVACKARKPQFIQTVSRGGSISYACG